MKTKWKNKLLATLLIGVWLGLTPQLALAAGTAVCTSVVNTATVAFDVGAVAQTPITSADSTFDVANKVNLTVVTTDLALVSVSPGATLGVLTFTVTNNGNSVQDYNLSGATLVGVADPFGGAVPDSFDAAAYAVYAESGATAGYQAGEDTAAFIDELAVDGTATAYGVVSGSPAILLTQAIDSVAVYALIANTHDGGAVGLGAETTNATTTTVGACTVPNVLADLVAGDDDVAKDGAHSDRSAFVVASAVITIGKTVTTIWDPINFNAGQQAIPGALVTYVVTIDNAAAATASATLTTISDALVASLAIDPDFRTQNLATATPTAESAVGSGFKALVTGGTRDGSGGLTNGIAGYYTTASDADGIEFAAPTITATLATVLGADTGGGTPYTAGELKPNEILTITFNAIIQ